MTCVILLARQSAVMDSVLAASIRVVEKRELVPCLARTWQRISTELDVGGINIMRQERKGGGGGGGYPSKRFMAASLVVVGNYHELEKMAIT